MVDRMVVWLQFLLLIRASLSDGRVFARCCHARRGARFRYLFQPEIPRYSICEGGVTIDVTGLISISNDWADKNLKGVEDEMEVGVYDILPFYFVSYCF